MDLSICFELLKHHKKFLLTLFLASFIVRIVSLFFYFQYNPCITLFDAGHYHTLAQSLTQGLGFVGADGAPYFYRLPGYPGFLAICYVFAGVKPIAALIAQCFISSFIPLLIFWLSQVLFPTSLRIAQWSSMISCLHVGYAIYANLLMAESLFLIFFLIFLIFFLEIYASTRLLFFAGLALGIASLIRPVGHFVIIIALVLLFLKSSVYKKYFYQAGMLCAGWAAIVGWWLVRNYLLTGMLFFHTLSGPHFINHSAIRLAQAHDHLTYEQAKADVYDRVNAALALQEQIIGCPLNQAEQSCVMEKVAFEYLKKDFSQTIKHCCVNIFKTAFSLYSSELLVIEQNGNLPVYDEQRSLKSMIKRFLCPTVRHKAVWFVIYFELAIWLVILFGCIGFCIQSFFCKIWLDCLIKVVPFILLFLILSCACGFARLRLPIEHFLIMLAVAFWTSFLNLDKSVQVKLIKKDRVERLY